MVTFAAPSWKRKKANDSSVAAATAAAAAAVRTSESHPMNVSWVGQSDSGGRFGLTFCPGKTVNRGGVRYSRNLDADLHRLKKDFGVTSVVCLLNQAELASLKLRNYAEQVTSKGLRLYTFPIVEMAAPLSLKKTADFIDLIQSKLREGEVMIIHCKGGVGRAGLVASCLLLQLNAATSSADAISKVRKLRCKTAVESYCQEQFISKYANFIRSGGGGNSSSQSPERASDPHGRMDVKWEVFQKKNLNEHTFFAKNDEEKSRATTVACS